MANIGTLVTTLSANTQPLSKGLQQGSSMVGSFAASVGKLAGAVAIGTMISDGLKSGLTTLKQVGMEVVSLSANAEQMRIQFEVLTGSAKDGSTMFKQIEKFAARTSFNLESAGDAAKSLMASGVNRNDVMQTMQLLGDLAMGDANKLGFLSKAYTDVLNKGKLQAQEIKQFSENGVGIAAALGKMLGKSSGQIMEMASAGQISFEMTQQALQSLTAEGGRFHNMMGRMNETALGQWNSLVEGVQTFGRSIGDMVLPKLTEWLKVSNEIVTGLNNLGEDKWKAMGDLIKAAFKDAIEAIKQNWKQMLTDVLAYSGKTVVAAMSGDIKAIQGLAREVARSQFQSGGKSNFQQALDRIRNAKEKVNPADAAAEAKRQLEQQKGAKLKADGAKLAEGFGQIFDALKPVGAALGMDIQGIKTQAEIKAGATKGLFERWFGGDQKNNAEIKTGATKTQFSDAMLKGSQEAFRTILNSRNGSTDPVVKATEKQTKELIKNLKPKGMKAPVFAQDFG